MTIMLFHLTGSLKGRSQYFHGSPITIGVGEGCGVTFDPTKDPIISSVHAELSVENQIPIIRDRSGQNGVLVNGHPTAETALRDGDLLQFGDQGPQVRFHTLPDGVGGRKPWRHIVADSRELAVRTPHSRYSSVWHLGRYLLTEIVHNGSPAVKLLALVALLLPLVLVVAWGLVLYQQVQLAGLSEREIARLISRIETGRMTQVDFERRIKQEREAVAMLRREQEELQQRLSESLQGREAARKSQDELKVIRQKLDELETSQHFAEDVIGRFENSVGLLQGGYGLKETASGRPLRYQGFDEQGNPLLDKEGTPLVTLEGDTPPVVIYYAGTGFLIDKQGTILTNRHLVWMWETYPPVQEVLKAGYEPDVHVLRIFFPGLSDPYPLKVLRVSDQGDLAVLRTERPPTGLTPIPLAPNDDTVQMGEPVIILGYPGTFDSLLSRLPAATSQEVLRIAGTQPLKLAETLSQKRLVRPLATQGHISDVSPKVITYEARSASGSSGGAVLNRKGGVIAINHSVLRRIGGVNLGLPIRFARELIEPLNDPERN